MSMGFLMKFSYFWKRIRTFQVDFGFLYVDRTSTSPTYWSRQLAIEVYEAAVFRVIILYACVESYLFIGQSCPGQYGGVNIYVYVSVGLSIE